MSDLSTTYLGLKLSNPLVAASSTLTSSLDKVKKCEQAGLAAVVLKSLFEEQIVHDASHMIEGMNYDMRPEAYDFLQVKSKEYYMNEYLSLVEDSRKAVSIPVIASINCVTPGRWLEYARQLQDAGADAIELNTFIIPANGKLAGPEIEEKYLEILSAVKDRVSVPVSMKIGSHFTGMSRFMHLLCDRGADGLVLFNRFYKPDIDIERLKLKAGKLLSAPEEMGVSLQWIALMSGELSCDLAATTGVYDADGVIKQLLAGAKAVQLCSTLMKNGMPVVRKILDDLGAWMERKGYAAVSGFCGMLAQERSSHPEAYERSQYVKAIVGIE